MVEDVVVGFEDAVREPIVAHELPDVLNRIELGRFRRQRQERDVVWDGKPLRDMPSRLIKKKDGVRRARPQARFPPDEAPWLHCCRRVVRARRLFLRPGRWRRKYRPNSSSGRAAPKAVSRVSPIGGGACFFSRSEVLFLTQFFLPFP